MKFNPTSHIKNILNRSRSRNRTTQTPENQQPDVVAPPNAPLSLADLDKKYAVNVTPSVEATNPVAQEVAGRQLPFRTVINLSLFGEDQLLKKCLSSEKVEFSDYPDTAPEAEAKMAIVFAEMKRIQGFRNQSIDSYGQEIRKGRDMDANLSLLALQKYAVQIRTRFGLEFLERAIKKVV